MLIPALIRRCRAQAKDKKGHVAEPACPSCTGWSGTSGAKKTDCSCGNWNGLKNW